MNSIKRAVVLASGGLDSTTVLAMAKEEGFECHTISFDYGQRHRVELQAAERISHLLGAASHKVVSLDLRSIGGSALTDDRIAVPDASNATGLGEIPVTYVPARNTVFLSIALGFAEVLGAQDIFLGVNAVDFSGYPDCRPEYITAYEAMANLATKSALAGSKLRIRTPLMAMSKAEIIRAGLQLGIDYRQTVSCYQADNEGKACGRCDSCELRRQGFEAAGILDQTFYADS